MLSQTHSILGRAQLAAPVDQVDFPREARQKQRLFSGAVAAADHRDILIAIERTVARGAGRHALAAEQFLFSGDAGHPRRCAGCDDHAARLDRTLRGDELARLAAEIDRRDQHLLKASAELRGLLPQVVHQLETVDAFGKPGEILHFAGGRELAARLGALEDERIEVGSRGVDRRRQSGAAGADDHDILKGGSGHALKLANGSRDDRIGT
jgi:hypothetical protein